MKSMHRLMLMAAVAMGIALMPVAAMAQGGGSIPLPGLDVALIDASENVLDSDTTDSGGAWELVGDDEGVEIVIDVSGTSDTSFGGTFSDDGTPLANVVVKLRDSSNCILDSDITDSNGMYQLDAGAFGPADNVIIINPELRPPIPMGTIFSI